MASHTTKSPEYIFRETFPEERAEQKKRYYKSAQEEQVSRKNCLWIHLNGEEINWGLEERSWR